MTLIVEQKWTNTMRAYLPQHFGKMMPNVLMKEMGISYKELSRHGKKYDRGGRESFKLEELNDLAELIANQNTMEDIADYFKDIKILAIYEQILALQEWNKLPEYEPSHKGSRGELAWTDEKDEFIRDAIRKGVHFTEVHIPGHTAKAVQLRYYHMRKQAVEGEKWAKEIIERKGEPYVEQILPPKPDKRRGRKSVPKQSEGGRKRIETKVEVENKHKPNEIVMPMRYYVFKGIQRLRSFATLEGALGYRDAYIATNFDIKYPMQIHRGYLELVKEEEYAESDVNP